MCPERRKTVGCRVSRKSEHGKAFKQILDRICVEPDRTGLVRAENSLKLGRVGGLDQGGVRGSWAKLGAPIGTGVRCARRQDG